MELSEISLNHAVTGGCILGGGGGGSIKSGIESGMNAIRKGNLLLTSLESLNDEDMVLCVSAVGAASPGEPYICDDDFIRSVVLYKKYSGSLIKGLITNECGGLATVNGWIQSAVLGIPLIDAACNGRAHPTGLMGGLGLHRQPGFKSIQTVCGGDKNTGEHIELMLTASLTNAAKTVKNSAYLAGGLVAVARNAVPAKYIRENAAVNAISFAIKTGEVFHKGIKIDKSGAEAVTNAVEFLKGEILAQGFIKNYTKQIKDGLETGNFTVNGYYVTVWNEFMSVDKDKRRIATFPDLITVFDGITGKPLVSNELREDKNIILAVSSKTNLKLAKTMYDRYLLEDIERVLKIDICSYI